MGSGGSELARARIDGKAEHFQGLGAEQRLCSFRSDEGGHTRLPSCDTHEHSPDPHRSRPSIRESHFDRTGQRHDAEARR